MRCRISAGVPKGDRNERDRLSAQTRSGNHARGGDLIYAWLAATALSGIPSTLYALSIGGDIFEATRAAGAMLLPPSSAFWALFAAAGVVLATIRRPSPVGRLPRLPWRTVSASIAPAESALFRRFSLEQSAQHDRVVVQLIMS
jgi:hypothetical protein